MMTDRTPDTIVAGRRPGDARARERAPLPRHRASSPCIHDTPADVEAPAGFCQRCPLVPAREQPPTGRRPLRAPEATTTLPRRLLTDARLRDDEMPTGVRPPPPRPSGAPADRRASDDEIDVDDDWDQPPTREIKLSAPVPILSPVTQAPSPEPPPAQPPPPPPAAPILDNDALLKAHLLSEAGARIGHFTILRQLDQGGMGLIFAAQDEELGRKVALKLLRSALAQDSVGRAHLRHEAQALARLAHPNVVTVHEIGEVAGHIFVAMELVEGRTLRAWLKLKKRSWREIVAIFVQAGRGLAAAHEAGITHRDFKPNNVLVGHDGRARVLDFGLALADGGPAPQLEGAAPSFSSGSSRLGGGATVIAGTPPYMAPEQLNGGDIDARADQFSFCVALAEALYGQRPFRGKTIDECRQHLSERPEPALPRSAKVPAFLRAALVQGLHFDPAQRFPSMAVLLTAIDRDPMRTRGRLALGIGLGLALLGAGFLLARRDPAASCAAREDPTAALWEQRRDEIHRSIAATGIKFAEATWDKVAPRLDAYAGALRTGDQDACAAHQRGERSDELYGRQLTCLNHRRFAFKALTDTLAAPDLKAIESAMQGAGELPTLASCNDIAALTAAIPPPEDPAVAAEIEGLRERLESARLSIVLRRSAEGLAIAAPILARARELGYRPLAAEVAGIVGRLQMIAADYPAAEASLTDAVWLADLVGDDTLLADHMANLISVIGYELARHDDALRWRRHADTVIARLPPGSRGESRLLAAIATVLFSTSRLDEALELSQRSLAIVEALDGPDHERVAAASVGVATVQMLKGDLPAARASFTRGLQITEASLGPDHPRVADQLQNLGAVDGMSGDTEAAFTHLQRALAIEEAILGPDHPDLSIVLGNLGSTIAARGDPALARSYQERALALEEKARGPEHPSLAVTLDNLGGIDRDLGDLARARAHYERALAIREKTLTADDPNIALSLSLLGDLDISEGKANAARRRYTRALALLEARPADVAPDRLAQTRHSLAHVLRLLKVELPRQRELAGLALAAYRELDATGYQAKIAELESWLSEPPPGPKRKKKPKKKPKKKTTKPKARR